MFIKIKQKSWEMIHTARRLVVVSLGEGRELGGAYRLTDYWMFIIL